MNIHFSVFCLLLWSTAAQPVDLQKKDLKIFHLPFTVKWKDLFAHNHTIANSTKLLSSSGTHKVSIPNEGSFYSADIELGSNKQPISVILDTGSSDLWVPATSSCLSIDPCDSGSFNQLSSTSYKSSNEDFGITYGVQGSTTYARGSWGTDVLNWGDISVKDIKFGLATRQTIGQGILGISFKGTESASTPYDNFPILLKSQGLIDKVAYSLYLDTTEAASGSIIFGGIDTAKFKGDLTYFDIVKIDDGGNPTDEAVAFFVEFNGVLQDGLPVFSGSYSALLDSGTTLIYGPSEVATAAGLRFGVYNFEVGGYVTSCDATGSDLHFVFGKLNVTVPFSQILWPTGMTDLSGKSLCLIGILDSGLDHFILGDSYLRSAYVYYNIEDSQVGMAQAVYTDKTNIVQV